VSAAPIDPRELPDDDIEGPPLVEAIERETTVLLDQVDARLARLEVAMLEVARLIAEARTERDRIVQVAMDHAA
jgi:hypothetical protein